MKRKTERIKFFKGCEDNMGRPIYGLFEVVFDMEGLRQQMVRAHGNNSRMSWNGAVGVIFRPMTESQAEFLIQQESKRA